MMKVRLHQFPFSHFNEKARWALAHKQVQYERVGYLPGPHMGAIKKLSGQTSTPVLEAGDKVIAGSANIIDYLEREYRGHSLYPVSAEERSIALDLCRRMDKELGPATRTILFSAMVNETAYMTGMFSTGKPFPHRLFYRLTFPLARGLIKKANGVNPENIKHCREILDKWLAELGGRIAQGEFLVGRAFSVADLTAAALLAPLANPSHPDMARPEPVPDSVQAIIDEYTDHPVIQWVANIYANHRPG